jgi:hypothetical protein
MEINFIIDVSVFLKTHFLIKKYKITLEKKGDDVLMPRTLQITNQE